MMEVVDGEWIKSRLPARRGAKAEFARAVGLDMSQVSRILKGERRAQADEIPRVLAYVRQLEAPTGQPPVDAALQLYQEIDRITAEEAQILLATLRALRAARHEADK